MKKQKKDEKMKRIRNAEDAKKIWKTTKEKEKAKKTKSAINYSMIMFALYARIHTYRVIERNEFFRESMLITMMLKMKRVIAVDDSKWFKKIEDLNSRVVMRQFRKDVLNSTNILNSNVKYVFSRFIFTIG
jgi:hypothetical protein